MSRRVWLAFVVSNVIGGVLFSFGTIDNSESRMLSLMVGFVLLLPGILPAGFLVDALSRISPFVNSLPSETIMATCASVAILINCAAWLGAARLITKWRRVAQPQHP
jgi:hypothetical protein